ncbi:hypothetical protein HDU99_003628 [Rhizoclosmatium hyalinum]|nr:hypothetical protein HDU99_003628 [Rhizoclosmatium hyalinum]
MESLEQVQSRMQELNLKFMEHQRILVGQQREAVYDHVMARLLSKDLDEPVMLVEQDTEPRKRIRKIRLLQVSPPRPQTAVDSQITAVSKAADSSVSENAVFKDLKEQLNSVQKDLQNILQSTTKGVIRDKQKANEVPRSPVFPESSVSSQPDVKEEITESTRPILSKEVSSQSDSEQSSDANTRSKSRSMKQSTNSFKCETRS